MKRHKVIERGYRLTPDIALLVTPLSALRIEGDFISFFSTLFPAKPKRGSPAKRGGVSLLYYMQFFTKV
jgi:hypothetical protein